MVHTMKTVKGIARTPRRQHERSFKARLVEQCLVPGASVAAVALAGGVNANLLFRWRSEHLRAKRPIGAPASSAVLVPVHVTSGADSDAGSQPLAMAMAAVSTSMVAAAPGRSVRTTGVIELDIDGSRLRLRGPVDESSLCSVLRALRHCA